MKLNVKKAAADAAYNVVKKSLEKPKRMAVVIAAGGTSSRMGGVNKLFAEICNIPVLAMTINAFDTNTNVSEIVISANENDIQRVNELVSAYGFKKVTAVVSGGSNRVLSVNNGVSALKTQSELIAVHDGARPFVTETLINDVYNGAVKHNACIPAVPVKDTIKIIKTGFVGSTPDRASLYAVQTPQIFDSDLLKAALYNAIANNLTITDDCSAVEAMGGRVFTVMGSYENIKLTTPEDIPVAQAICEERLKNENRTRI